MLLILHKGEFVHKAMWHFEMLEETVGKCTLISKVLSIVNPFLSQLRLACVISQFIRDSSFTTTNYLFPYSYCKITSFKSFIHLGPKPHFLKI